MQISSSSPLILLAGPTASGKTALAIALASRLGGEIISADSMQIYEGCAIGTAQPTKEELGAIPYHLVACVKPWEVWTVADWLRETQRLVGEIRARGHLPIIAGGTGLYFKAFTNGLFECAESGRDEALRQGLEAEWEKDGGAFLRMRLEQADPASAGRIHAHDRVRTIRALEVFEKTGRPLSELQAEGRQKHRSLPACRLVMSAPRGALYRRIDTRVLQMMAAGFEQEVSDLLARGATSDWPAMRAIGYGQLMRMFQGHLSRDDAIREIQQLSRRYAKQQMVLYRNWPGSIWLDALDGVEKNLKYIEIVLEFLQQGRF